MDLFKDPILSSVCADVWKQHVLSSLLLVEAQLQPCQWLAACAHA